MKTWEGYKPAPIEVFHGEAMLEFHKLKKFDHTKLEAALGEKIGTVDGITFNRILAEFKVKIMKEYGITSDAVPTPNSDTPA